MANSAEQAFIRWQASRAGANLPVDTAQSLRNLVGNTQHAYDEHFQCRANWVSESSSKFFTPLAADATYPQYVHRIMFPYSVRHDGTGSLLIVRLFGRAPTASTTATWYIGVRAPLDAVRPPGGSGVNETTVQHTATTFAWADSAATSISLGTTAIAVAEMRLDSVASLAGSPVQVRQVMARLDVYATISGGGSSPELAGWLIREYVGT